ncbi:MAG: beta-glucosidase H [Fimbriimonas sp.]
MRISVLKYCCIGLVTSSLGTAAIASPKQTGEARVQQLLGRMTLEEKIGFIAGGDMMGTKAIPRLGIPSFRMSDGPVGAHNPQPSTAFAGGIGLAATWDADLARRVGLQIGRDARSRGAHFLLGPGVNIYRMPLNGRNFEYFGEDPLLGSRISTAYIQGVQSVGVSATVKHFLGNNSEFARNSSNTVIDERTLREIYLPIFEDAVKVGKVGAMMDAYNLTNGLYMSENPRFNTQVARKEWGFPGIMMSDWFATHSAVGAANGGLDLEMPFGANFNTRNLLPAIQKREVMEATIDEKVRRILRVAVRFGWLDRPQEDTTIPRFNQPGRATTLEAAQKGVVLLKNAKNLLPLRATGARIAVIGPNAYPGVPTGGGSGAVTPFHTVSLLEGLSNAVGAAGNVTFHRGLPSLAGIANRTEFTFDSAGTKKGLLVETFESEDASGTPVDVRTERVVNFGQPGFNVGGGDEDALPPEMNFGVVRPRPTTSRWTGYFTPKGAGSHRVFVQSSANFRLLVDGKVILDASKLIPFTVNQAQLSLTAKPHKVELEVLRNTGFGAPFLRLGLYREGSLVAEAAKTLAKQADVVVVAAGFDTQTETEGTDRDFRLPPGQDELIRTMASLNKKVVVVLNSGGSVDVSPWLGSVSGLLSSWYPGQEGGTALADILLGRVNPSGRLPISWERRLSDNPAANSYYFTKPGTQDIEYREGIFVGYRGFEKTRAKPEFPFGFGLSYTTFQYSNLTVRPVAKGNGPGPFFEVSVDVTNKGSRPGSEVVQVYVGERKPKVQRPGKELKGFVRASLNPGQTKRVSVVLNGRSFTYWDVNQNAWHANPGEYRIDVAHSSAEVWQSAKTLLTKAIDLSVNQ